MIFSLVALAFGSPDCGFADHMRVGALPSASVPLLPGPPPPPPSELRDPFGPPSYATSDHFALRWGDGIQLTAQEEAFLLDILEEVWELQVEEEGWWQPAGTERHKLNVYLGNSGSGAPDIAFSGGYVSLDRDDFPYMVLSMDLVDRISYDPDSPWPFQLIAHEFNHTLQVSRGGFYLPTSVFYYEATAEWMVHYLEQDKTDSFRGFGHYLNLPWASVNTHDFGDEVLSGRQYDAGLFFVYLTDNHWDGDRDPVRDSWATGVEADPLVLFDDQLEGGVREAFAGFAAANTTLDYGAFGPALVEGADQVEWYAPELNMRTTGEFSDGTNKLTPPFKQRPMAFGYNVWRAGTMNGTVHVAFEGVPKGSSGTDSAFVVELVLGQGEEHRRERVQLVDGAGELEVATDGAVSVALVVSAVPESQIMLETFDYTVTVDVVEEVVQKELQSQSSESFNTVCGCNASASVSVAPWAWGLRRR